MAIVAEHDEAAELRQEVRFGWLAVALDGFLVAIVKWAETGFKETRFAVFGFATITQNDRFKNSITNLAQIILLLSWEHIHKFFVGDLPGFNDHYSKFKYY